MEDMTGRESMPHALDREGAGRLLSPVTLLNTGGSRTPLMRPVL
jgi:hypothetical protein